jgi:hypothetical protein
MRRIYPLILFFSLFVTTSYAQQNHVVNSTYDGSSPSYDKLNLGVGLGFDYGGIGGNLTFYPQKNIGLFFGGGYAIAGFGYNTGIKIRFLPEKHSSQFTPFLIAMYGYNAAVHVSNASQYDKLFYGPTVGAGFDLGSHEVGKGAFSLAIFVPIRSSEPNDYMNHLQNDYGISFPHKLLPIGFSFGYRFNLN